MSANWLNNVMYKFTLRLKFFMIDVNNWVFILCFLTPTSLHLFFCIFYIFPYRYLSSGSIIVIWMETITIKFKSFIENKWVWRIQLWLGTSTSIGRKWWSDSKQVFIYLFLWRNQNRNFLQSNFKLINWVFMQEDLKIANKS